MKRYKMLILGLAATMAVAAPIFAKEASGPAIIMEEKALDNRVIINGKLIEGKIYTEQGQKMVPLRKSAEALGFKVNYDDTNNTINLDNGIIKTTLTIGKDLYYKASSLAIGLTQQVPLGVAPTIIDGSTYIPVSLYNLLYSNDQTVTVKENTIIINTEDKKDTFKKVEFTIGENKHTLSMNVPSEVSEYVNFEKQEVGEKENKHIVLLLEFSKGDKVANIASFSAYTLNQYEALKKEGGPMPQELINNKEDNMIVAFSGLQSNPFETGTEEAKLIDNYQANIKQMLETVKVD